MELRQLKYFLVTAETLHFSHAAEVLYMSQPALSKQIAELEKELGVTLFVRDKRGVQITPAGLRLQAEARKLLHQAEQLRPLIQNLPDSGVSRHSLFVGVDSKASTPFASSILVLTPLFNNLSTKHSRASCCQTNWISSSLSIPRLPSTVDLIP